MRTKVKVALPEVVLTRILEAFGQELIDASDEEIMEAAKDLGMDLLMKGSGAFAGLTFPAKWQLSDFFDVEAINQHIGRVTKASSTDSERETHRPKQSEISTDRKNFGEK
jgi:DNA-directed RNA polymerase delta subunit